MRRRLGFALGIAFAVALTPAAPAGATITVANTNNAGAGSLRKAINDAAPGETIVVPAGTYTLTTKPLEVAGSMTIEGAGSSQTIIRSGGSFRVLETSGEPGSEVTLSKLTIRDGRDPSKFASGGGIYSVNCNLTLREALVTENIGGDAANEAGIVSGGGIYSSGGQLHLIHSSVTGNRLIADSHAGGLDGNLAGAGIYSAGGTISLLESTISGNVAESSGSKEPTGNGAGLYATTSLAPEQISISRSTISGNLLDVTPEAGSPGGFGSGAGAYISSGEGPLSIDRSTIANNTLRGGKGEAFRFSGAGIEVSHDTGGTPGLLSGLTIAGNKIEGEGKGGNLRAYGQVSIIDTIITGGTAGGALDNCDFGDGFFGLGFNLENGDTCQFHLQGDKWNTDPQLGPLQDNGGPTQTMIPSPGSPAIDSGTSPGVNTDQRGVVRPIDFPAIPSPGIPGADGSDIGAVELQPVSAVTLGKLSKNVRKGTATLAISVPLPSTGTLVLEGKGLKKQTKAITGQEKVRLTVAAVGKPRKGLVRKGKRKFALTVIYTPTANVPAVATRKTKLVKRLHKSKHGHKGRHGTGGHR